MEAREGDTVLGSDAPSEYQIAQRSEHPNSTPASAPPHPTAAEVVMGSAEMIQVKKKRARPRKYGAESGEARKVYYRPKSSAAPAPPQLIDFTAGKRPANMKPFGSKGKYELQSLGDWVACSVGANFTPHIITVDAGEDITMKVISFLQQGPRAICILSANGVISSVLRQPDSFGGTLTYEGRFEILSLSGSFMHAETAGTRSRTGGMSISLASPDRRVIGGGVAGLLVAANSVQVVVGSFLAGNQREQKQKKQKPDPITIINPTAAIPFSSTDPKNHFSSSSYHAGSWSSLPIDSRNQPADITISLQAV